MKIELVSGEQVLWVRALTNEQIGPQAWPDVEKQARELYGPDAFIGWSTMAGFYSQDVPEYDDEWENYRYEQWFTLNPRG